MAIDKQFFANLTTRQKITGGLFVVIVIFLIWQVMGLFGGGGETAPAVAQAITPMGNAAPTPTPVPKQTTTLSPREMELLKLQQETEAKYIAALNELQMLKIEREIAENNKAIMAAKLDAITAQKNIVTLLSPPAPQVLPGAYAQGLGGGAASGGAPTTGPGGQPIAAEAKEADYTVVSVSQLQRRWSAVLGYQSNLYNVSIGDVLPPDGSTVVSINQSGVVLQKDGAKRKVSLVPII